MEAAAHRSVVSGAPIAAIVANDGQPSPGDAAREVAELGSTVLRQVWPREPLAIIRQAIVDFTNAREARLARGEEGPHERMYSMHGVGTFAELVAAGFLHEGILGELFRGSYYHKLCSEYFGDDTFYAAPKRLGYRNHDPLVSGRSFIPYHQDSYTQDARYPKVLNCWMPLDPGAGVESPGLEVVRNPCRPNFPRKDFGLRSENAAYDFITIAREAIAEEYGESFLAPSFEIGDGFVFSENVIHRTYVTPEMTKPRINFEFRVFSPKHLGAGATIEDLASIAVKVS
ncbi:MAG TPA: hypothetical protein VHL34_05520 [Rhizomicrobium sp.]|nr:hypothetical protein [Rhizomicrobium sp.]